jgi:hypothetical protein
MKKLLLLLFMGCQPETIIVPEIYEIRDTLYVHDTSYVAKEASFAIATMANVSFLSGVEFEVLYWYSLTKLDSVFIDSVFLIGYLFEWGDMNTIIIDSTRSVAFPDNAYNWNFPLTKSVGEFPSDTKFHVDDWADRLITYSLALEYK